MGPSKTMFSCYMRPCNMGPSEACEDFLGEVSEARPKKEKEGEGAETDILNKDGIMGDLATKVEQCDLAATKTNLFCCAEIMCNSNKSGNLLVDEVDVEIYVQRKMIANIVQNEFAREINRLLHEELKRSCEGCEMDALTQEHHDSIMMEEKEMWINYNEMAKTNINLKKLWRTIETLVTEKLDLDLKESWLNYLLHLVTMDDTSAYLIYKDFIRRQNKIEDENYV
ncbi:hypothetical protein ACROYT_G015026 [Oculina patagonica]